MSRLRQHALLVTLLAVGFSAILPANVSAKERLSPIKVDHKQVRQWNRFADSLVTLYEYVVGQVDTRTEEEVGGYGGIRAGDVYREVRYYDKTTGKLLANVQWELDNPDNVHAIEVYLYDETGTLEIDYGAAYLPGHRNAPMFTMVNFHGDDPNLKSFRQFDASGERIYEQCYGQYFADEVDISLEDYQLLAPGPEETALMKKDTYLACFGDVPKQVGKYLDPLTNIPAVAKQETDTVVVDASSRYQQRIKELSRQIDFNQDHARLYVERAVEYFNLLEFDNAEADLDKAIKLDDGLAQAYFWRGMVRGRQQGRVAEGIADLSRFLELKPDSSLGYTKRGVRYIWNGQYDEAERDLRMALDINPGNAEAHDDFGVLMARKKKLDKAIEHFSKTIKLEPTYHKAYHNRATAYYLQGKYAQALRSVERSISLKPDNRGSVLLKSEIVAAMGYQDEAEELRKKANLLPVSGWSEQFSLK